MYPIVNLWLALRWAELRRLDPTVQVGNWNRLNGYGSSPGGPNRYISSSSACWQQGDSRYNRPSSRKFAASEDIVTDSGSTEFCRDIAALTRSD